MFIGNSSFSLSLYVYFFLTNIYFKIILNDVKRLTRIQDSVFYT